MQTDKTNCAISAYHHYIVASSNPAQRSKMKEVTSSSLANNNMLKVQETQTIENTLHLPLPDNVK
jgi:hypothetical protein